MYVYYRVMLKNVEYLCIVTYPGFETTITLYTSPKACVNRTTVLVAPRKIK